MMRISLKICSNKKNHENVPWLALAIAGLGNKKGHGLFGVRRDRRSRLHQRDLVLSKSLRRVTGATGIAATKGSDRGGFPDADDVHSL
ncbi:MAG: hypothetical protein HF973_03955 [Chloroflexi bacterium]|nr:hypothetical protein [Chloroflexota bacterium]